MRAFVAHVRRTLLKTPDIVVVGQNRKRKDDSDEGFFFSSNSTVEGTALARDILTHNHSGQYANEMFSTTAPEGGVSFILT